MDRIHIKIKTTNAAFEEDALYEVARILKELSTDFERGREPSTKNDINGNKVCFIEYEE